MDKLLLPAIHLSILLGFLTFKLKSPFQGFMKSRHKDISEGLNRSKVEAAEAEARKKDIDAKLSSLDIEKQRILGEWKEREAQQLKALEESSQKLIAQMKAEAVRNRAALEETFRLDTIRGLAQVVLSQAEQKVRAGLNPGAHTKLNDQFMKVIGG